MTIRASPGPTPNSPAASPSAPPLTTPETRVDQHADILFRYALIRLRDRASAEDVVQETFLAALIARPSFQGQASERTWLISILRHKLADRFRAAGRQSSLPDPVDETVDGQFTRWGEWKRAPARWTPRPEELLEHEEFRAALARCLDALPPRLAEVFALRVVDETDPAEVCKVLAISPTNLWVLLHRARSRLRRCLETHWFAPRE